MAVSLKARALKLLAGREHTRQELRAKLRTHSEIGGELEALLDELERRKLLSDERYAEARAHQLGKKFGPARIAYDLRAKGVSEDTVARTMAGQSAQEFEQAQRAWAKRFGSAPRDPLEKAKQMRFLQGRGFSIDVIRRVVPRVAAPD